MAFFEYGKKRGVFQMQRQSWTAKITNSHDVSKVAAARYLVIGPTTGRPQVAASVLPSLASKIRQSDDVAV